MFTANGDYYGYEQSFLRQSQTQIQFRDMLIGITYASGRSPSPQRALRASKSVEITFISLCRLKGDSQIFKYLVLGKLCA